MSTQERFANLGVTYSMGGDTGNTFDSHRLIAWAGDVHGATAQNNLVEQLFRAYMCNEQCIQDTAVLEQAAADAGLPRTDAARVLGDASAYADTVRADMKRLARGVTGVPHFIVNGTTRLSGAQPPEDIERALRQAAGQKTH